jgi:localization factor PodJL
MRKDGLFRPIPGAAIAAFLFLGGCAQVTDALQDASDGLAQFLGEDTAPSEGTSPGDTSAPAAAATAKNTSSKSAEEASTQKPDDGLYQKALAARARGAEKEAFKSFREAAGKRHPAAAYETAQAYLEGRGVKADQAKGTLWMDRAAAFGEARAQFYMGQAYAKGEGIKQDETKAAARFTQAAEQGHAGAQYALGEAYSAGRGVPKNQPWAARWYGKAAHRGLREAQYAYGLVHARGLGLPIDRTEGYRWLLLAARAGHERAEVVRRALQTKMAPEMVKLAEVWADRFQPRRESPFADPPTVMYVQQVLNDMGFKAGPVDGKPGKRTRGAVGKYQKNSGQTRNTRISPQLVDRLLAEQAKAP